MELKVASCQAERTSVKEEVNASRDVGPGARTTGPERVRGAALSMTVRSTRSNLFQDMWTTQHSGRVIIMDLP